MPFIHHSVSLRSDVSLSSIFTLSNLPSTSHTFRYYTPNFGSCLFFRLKFIILLTYLLILLHLPYSFLFSLPLLHCVHPYLPFLALSLLSFLSLSFLLTFLHSSHLLILFTYIMFSCCFLILFFQSFFPSLSLCFVSYISLSSEPITFLPPILPITFFSSSINYPIHSCCFLSDFHSLSPSHCFAPCIHILHTSPFLIPFFSSSLRHPVH